MKVSRNKILSAVIGGVIIAGAGGYALADQASRPSVPAISSSIASAAVSQASSAPDTEVSSKMEESSSPAEGMSKAPASAPSKTVLSAPAASASSAREENSMKPNTAYYAVVDPDTGKLVWPGDTGYWALKKQLGGDAGTIDPAHSTACQKAREEFKAKQATVPTK